MNAVRIATSAVVVLALLGGQAPRARAGEILDHLACRKVTKDVAERAKVALDSRIDGRGERSCKIKKAALLCSPAARISTVPTPPLDVIDGTEVQSDLLCYRARCRGGGGEQPVADAFGERTVALSRSSLICVPASLGDHL